MLKNKGNSTHIEIPQANLKQRLIDDVSESDRSTQSEIDLQKSQKNTNSKKSDKPKKKFSWPIYKKLFEYTKIRWKLAIFALLAQILSAFITSLIPYKIGCVLDCITMVRENEETLSTSELNQEILGLLVIIVVMAIVTSIRYSSTQFLQEFLSIDMKTDIYSKFMRNDVYFFEQYKSGELVSRLGTDINQAKSAVSNNLTFFIRNMFTVVANIVIIFVMSWKLSLAVMSIIPFFGMVTIYYNRNYKPLVVEYQDAVAEMSAHVAEKFGGIQLVKAYSTEAREIAKYQKLNLKTYGIAKKKIFVMGVYMVSSACLPLIGTLIVLWYGGTLAIEGNSELTPGELTSFILYCTYLASNTSGLSSSYSNIVNGTSAVQKVFQMLGYEPEIKENEGLTLQIDGNITFEGVNFKYPGNDVQIFNDLSFKINKGQYVSFVGQSGSGKSTITKLIERFYQIQKGKILMGNTDSQHLNLGEMRKQIGMVNQEATIFSGTIEQNLAYGLESYTQEDLIEAALKSGCLEFIKNQQLFPKGFDTLLGEKGNNLSGGQKQRISIARALIRKPKVIIFDEATSALDANSEKMVQESIESLATDSEKITIIVIAHRLSTIINADRIMVMKAGRLIESGSHEELKQRRGYYYELVEKQLHED